MSEFNRIFTPRAAKAVKAISLLTNGAKYAPTQEEKDHTLDVLKEAVNDIAQLYGMLPATKPTPEVTSAPEGRVETSRIDAKIATIKASPFAREDIHANVYSIPDGQLTAYATSILDRICNKFDEPEAQPKNYVVKEP